MEMTMFKNMPSKKALLYRIFIWFAVVLAVVIAQGIYSINGLDSVNRSINAVHQSIVQVERLAREIAQPVANLRLLSMELVLAPNQKIISETSRKVEVKIQAVDDAISFFGQSFGEESKLVASEFSAIESAWARYKSAQHETEGHVNQSVRVASFISVTQQEKVAYDDLLAKINAFKLRQLTVSGNVYTRARKKSSTTYGMLVITTIVAVSVLMAIMFVVHRMVHGYVVAKQIYEEELSAATVKANAANQAKSEFLANMSHEIRTPMNAVLGFAEILGNKESDPSKSRYIKNIHSSGKALLSLINDILDLSKVEAGKLVMQYGSVSLAALLEELETIFTKKAQDKGIALSTTLPPDLPPALILDETRLRQVLINLIGNAIKFTDRGFIRIGASHQFPEQSHSHVNLTIRVQDSGVGIPVEQQNKIFEAFEQTTGQKVKEFGGTGLGLTISKRLIELMGGSISVQSEADEGSTFTIELPQVEIVTATAEERKTEAIDFGSPQFKPATVLIVDDIDYNRDILRTFLDDFGFSFREAADGQEALGQIYKQRPDLILLDMKMPGMDGYEVSRRLADDPSVSDIPVIAVTASALKEDVEMISQLCDGYLSKPVTHDELIRELMKHLKHSFPTTHKKEKEPPEKVRGGSPSKRSDLLEQLETVAYKQWERREQISISETGAFAEMLTKLGEQFEDPPLAAWSSRLQQAVATFDIQAIDEQMSEFPKMLQELKDDLSRLKH
jgi:signal transduction histidine kinase/DNA-binding response OmpR family regulator